MEQLNQCIHVKKSQIDATLSNSPVQGKKLLEPLKSFSLANKVPLNILEDHQLLKNEAEIHQKEGDLWCCLEGEVEFIYGGELVNPEFRKNADGTDNGNELKADEIKNGTTSVLKPGDWLWIPPGQPHQHTCKGTARLFIIKIPKSLIV